MAIRRGRLPRGVTYGLVIALPLAALPFALIARSRELPSRRPRVHIIQDMDAQPKLKAQAASRTFADERAMRPPVLGTVARGQLREDEHYEYGQVEVAGQWQWAQTYPARIEVTEDLLRRGRQRFDIYCAVCHGESGYGTGMVHERAMALEAPSWVPPSSLHSEEIRGRALGELFAVITAGVRTMPAYGPQIPVADRWAIVAYVKALQLSQHAEAKDVPEEERSTLR